MNEGVFTLISAAPVREQIDDRRERMAVKRPSFSALLLGLIPFAATCFSVSLWDRVDPMILGVPFNLVWLLAWIPLTSVCMWAAYRLETTPDADVPPYHQNRDPADEH